MAGPVAVGSDNLLALCARRLAHSCLRAMTLTVSRTLRSQRQHKQGQRRARTSIPRPYTTRSSPPRPQRRRTMTWTLRRTHRHTTSQPPSPGPPRSRVQQQWRPPRPRLRQRLSLPRPATQRKPFLQPPCPQYRRFRLAAWTVQKHRVRRDARLYHPVCHAKRRLRMCRGRWCETQAKETAR